MASQSDGRDFVELWDSGERETISVSAMGKQRLLRWDRESSSPSRKLKRSGKSRKLGCKIRNTMEYPPGVRDGRISLSIHLGPSYSWKIWKEKRAREENGRWVNGEMGHFVRETWSMPYRRPSHVPNDGPHPKSQRTGYEDCYRPLR